MQHGDFFRRVFLKASVGQRAEQPQESWARAETNADNLALEEARKSEYLSPEWQTDLLNAHPSQVTHQQFSDDDRLLVTSDRCQSVRNEWTVSIPKSFPANLQTGLLPEFPPTTKRLPCRIRDHFTF